MCHDCAPLFCSICLFFVCSCPQLWHSGAEKRGYLLCRYPFSTPCLQMCAPACVRLGAAADRSLQLPACPGVLWGRPCCCIPYRSMLAASEQFSSAKCCRCAAHCSAPGWLCCRAGRAAGAVKPCGARTTLERRRDGVCRLIRAGKSRLSGPGWTNPKEEFRQQQPRVASAEKAAWANLVCADNVFSAELNPSGPCKEVAFGDHILHGSCLLSSGWGKPWVYISLLRWKVSEFTFTLEKT